LIWINLSRCASATVKASSMSGSRIVQYLSTEDSRTVRKIGINVLVLIGVAFALVAVTAILSP
jgi:hypothetical protein